MCEQEELIRVMIADDHGMVRKGLIAYLKSSPDICVVGEARDGREALELCERLEPDVILMDLIMPEMGGVAATRQIHKRWPDIRIIALTSFKEKELVQEALKAGAMSYLLKDVTGSDLAQAIRGAFDGRSTLATEAVQALIQPDEQKSKIGSDLTRREKDVMSLLVMGLSNPEIAERMCVSRATVKVHVSHILSKLGVSNRAEAIALALEYELVPRKSAFKFEEDPMRY